MKIGFIGLGIMGKPMSRNLLKAGFELIVYDIDETAVKIIEKAGFLPERSRAKQQCYNNDASQSFDRKIRA